MFEIAEAYVIAEAIKILKKHPNLNEFISGMGLYHFIGKDDNSLLHNLPKYIAESKLILFIDEWDDFLRLSGNPLRIKADGSVIRDW